jgi:hypothetical protein
MTTRTYALIAGLVYLVVGGLGFVPGLVTAPPPEAPSLAVHHNYGYLFGMFPVNALHNVVHLLIGVWGLAAYQSSRAAAKFAAGLAIFYGLLAVAGLMPGFDTTFGLIPLWGHDVWLHAATALVSAYFAWGVRSRVANRV